MASRCKPFFKSQTTISINIWQSRLSFEINFSLTLYQFVIGRPYGEIFGLKKGKTGKFHKQNFKCVMLWGMDNFIIWSLEDFIEECLTWKILNIIKLSRVKKSRFIKFSSLIFCHFCSFESGKFHREIMLVENFK